MMTAEGVESRHRGCMFACMHVCMCVRMLVRTVFRPAHARALYRACVFRFRRLVLEIAKPICLRPLGPRRLRPRRLGLRRLGLRHGTSVAVYPGVFGPSERRGGPSRRVFEGAHGGRKLYGLLCVVFSSVTR